MSSETPAAGSIALDCISDPLLSLDTQWRVDYLNDAAAALFEERDAPRGTPLWEAWPGLEGTSAATALREARETGAATTVRLPWPDGGKRRARVYPGVDGLALLVTPMGREAADEPGATGPTDVSSTTDGPSGSRDAEPGATGGPEDAEAVLGRLSHGFFALDQDWEFTYVNERAAELIGHTPAGLEGMSIWEMYPEARGSTFQEEYERAMETQEPVEFESYFEPLDTWFRVNAYPSETGLSVYFTDISEEKRRQRELERVLDLYDRTQSLADVGGWEIDPESLDVLWTDQVYDILDLQKGEEPPLEEALDVYHPEDRPVIEAAVDDAIENGEPFDEELRVVRTDGEVRWVRVLGEPVTVDGEVDTLRGTFQDITRRRQRRMELERYETIVETMNDGVYTVDEDGRFTMVNEAYARMTGYSLEELIGSHVSKLVDEETIERAQELESELADGERVSPTILAELERADGSTFPAEARFALLGDGSAEGTERVGVVRDVTEREERERELEQTKNRFQTVFEQSDDGIFIVDPDADELVDANPAAAEMTGYTQDELQSLAPSDLHPDEMDRFRALLADAREEGSAWSEDLRCRHRDGHDIPAEVTSSPITLDGRDLVLVTLRHIGERKKHERYQRELYDITADVETSFDEKLDRLLELGRERFGLENGYFNRIDTDADEFEVVAAVGPHDMIEPGAVDSLEGTYCDAHLDTADPLSVADAADAGLDDLRACTEYELEAYFAATVYVGGDEYGTLCFASETPRERPFTDAERAFLDLMSQWLQYELDRQQRERALRESEEQLRALIDVLPVAVFVAEDDGELVEWNEAAEEMWGGEVVESDSVAEYEAYNGWWADTGEPVEPDEWALARALRGEEVTDPDEIVIEGFDGERRTVLNYGMPVRDADGEVDRAVVTLVDITERKEHERALAASEHRYRGLAENFPNGGVGVYDEDLRYTLVTGTMWDDIDPDPADLEGETIWECLPPETAADVEPVFRGALEGETDSVVSTLDGRRYQVWATPLRNADGEITGGQSFALDITEREERERELRESKNQLRALIDVLPVAVFVAEDDGELVEWNEAAEEIWGGEVVESESVAEYEAYDGWWADTGEPVEPDEWPIARALEGEAVTDPDEIVIEGFDGERRTVLNHGMPVQDGEGEVSRAVVTLVDITDQKERERELEHYETVAETASDVILTVDDEGRIQNVNPAVAEVFGYEPTTLEGEPLTTLMPDRFAGDHGAGFTQYLRTGERTLDWEYIELPGVRADGTEIPLAISFSEYVYDGDHYFTGIIRDITEREEREAELQRRLDQQAAVADLGRQALGGESLADLFESAVATVADTLDADYSKVLDLLPDEDELALRAGVGWEPGLVGEATVGTGRESQAGYTLTAEEPVVVEDFETETRFSGPRLLTEHDVRSGISVVIGPSEDPWGILGVHDRSARAFSETDVSFVQSVANVLATAIEREAYERQLKQYEVAVERSTDMSTILAEDGTVTYITPSVEDVLGYTQEEVVGDSVLEFLPEAEHEKVAGAIDEILEAPTARLNVEVRVNRKDGTEAVVEASARNLTDEPHIDGILVNTREVTERKERERKLREQRDELEALVTLNRVVREVNEVVLDASSRDELERRVCETLANSDAYAFAWVGEVDTGASEVVPRTSAGPHESYLESVSIPYGESTEPRGPSARALDTGETQVVRDTAGFEEEEWREAARQEGFRAAAAIPLRYGGRQYGILAVYTEREWGFDVRERDVISHLGESVGHAITALEHREALMSESMVQLELSLPSVGLPLEADDGTPSRLRVDRTIPLDDGRYLVYVSAEGLTESEVRTFLDRRGDVVSQVRRIGDHDDVVLYEWLLEEPPVISALGDHGGQVREVTLRETGATVIVELPAEQDVRAIVDTVTDEYPGASLVSQQQVTRESTSSVEYVSEVESKLTERQRQTLETAYGAGYYEWPRHSSASDVAEVLSIGDATVSQHLRAGHRKLCETLFERGVPDRNE